MRLLMAADSPVWAMAASRAASRLPRLSTAKTSTTGTAMTMARRSPDATVWALDVNPRARDLCRRNADRNRLDNVRVVAPDEVPDDVRFATIWSNPPIRIGKPALRELLLRWLARLDDDGTATLVVQKHLGADSLQRWLVAEGHPSERIASKTGFRLISVGPARGATPGDRPPTTT